MNLLIYASPVLFQKKWLLCDPSHLHVVIACDCFARPFSLPRRAIELPRSCHALSTVFEGLRYDIFPGSELALLSQYNARLNFERLLRE